MARMHNLLGNKNISTEIKNKTTETSKTIETPTAELTNTQITNTSNTNTPTEIKINKNIIKSIDEKWVKTIDGLPEENRALIFNTDNKKQIFGYRLPNGDYVVDDAYSINIFKKKNGYLEWQYVNCGNTLDFCEKGFPHCLSCKAFRQKE